MNPCSWKSQPRGARGLGWRIWRGFDFVRQPRNGQSHLRIGQAGDGCYMPTSRPLWFILCPAPRLNSSNPSRWHVHGRRQPMPTLGFTDSELLATGDTLYNYEEEYVFEVVATNTAGCAQVCQPTRFPGTFDLIDMDIQSQCPHCRIECRSERASCGCASRLLWSQTLGGSTVRLCNAGRMATGHAGISRRYGVRDRALMSALAVTPGHTLRLGPRNSPRELCRTLLFMKSLKFLHALVLCLASTAALDKPIRSASSPKVKRPTATP